MDDEWRWMLAPPFKIHHLKFKISRPPILSKIPFPDLPSFRFILD
jgi:hypothetical protein